MGSTRLQNDAVADVDRSSNKIVATLGVAMDRDGELLPAPSVAVDDDLDAGTQGRLSPNRHPQRDFFVADILDAAPKDDLASMEHPLFALRAGDKRVRVYERNGTTVTIKPGPDGCATIHDKDLWIYCISQLVEAINRGRKDVERVVRLTGYDFLVATNRRTDGDSYKRLGDALARLSGTRVETNIATDGRRERSGFGLVESWRIIERDHDNRMVAIEITLPDWLWRSVKAKHVLTLSHIGCIASPWMMRGKR
ncbi:replication initiator protein A [Caballeronia sp. INDeC2]|uniref:replication initiator protein A n=1 Tax=Caballeronia sp. INDeC2 TaxID=2921747 RepID=UPI002027DBAD|nr:replication initiator protein A [Caballeronia sp. INDeC2]